MVFHPSDEERIENMDGKETFLQAFPTVNGDKLEIGAGINGNIQASWNGYSWLNQ